MHTAVVGSAVVVVVAEAASDQLSLHIPCRSFAKNASCECLCSVHAMTCSTHVCARIRSVANSFAKTQPMHVCVRPFDCAVVSRAAGMHGHARSAAADVIRARARNDNIFGPVRASEVHADTVAAALLASWLC